MSLPYYRFFPGDYARDTRHLSITQHGAYRLLIDLYMDTGAPLRNDLNYLYRFLHAESIEEKAAVEFILAEFFELSTGKTIGWKHKRCDQELAWRADKTKQMSETARKRWECIRNADAMRTQYKGNDNQNQINTKTARRVDKSQGPNSQWWETESGMLAKGKELGTEPRAGEGWPQFKDRLFQSLKSKANT